MHARPTACSQAGVLTWAKLRGGVKHRYAYKALALRQCGGGLSAPTAAR